MTNIQIAQHVMEHGLVLIRPMRTEHVKGTDWQYDVKEHRGSKRGWTFVDTQTANAILTVYNALSEENKKKIGRVPFAKLVDFCWSKVV